MAAVVLVIVIVHPAGFPSIAGVMSPDNGPPHPASLSLLASMGCVGLHKPVQGPPHAALGCAGAMMSPDLGPLHSSSRDVPLVSSRSGEMPLVGVVVWVSSRRSAASRVTTAASGVTTAASGNRCVEAGERNLLCQSLWWLPPLSPGPPGAPSADGLFFCSSKDKTLP